MIDDFQNSQVSLVALLEAVDQRKDVDVTEALHEEELDGDLEALDLVEYAQVAIIKNELDNNKSNKKMKTLERSFYKFHEVVKLHSQPYLHICIIPYVCCSTVSQTFNLNVSKRKNRFKEKNS